MIKPITPAEVENKEIPDEIIAAFNALILKNWTTSGAKIDQEDVLRLAMKNFKESGKEISADKVFDNGWMDVESVFKKEGWRVTYDKPVYLETYYYIFKK